ncbi:MAG TPA: indole-3-glycerol phosphate synthase TrpC [Virgibacillus sp.]|nr:indole-3-glycerol phosphate synthase TrpC [Virgibacillus sp.]HLR67396.1 indole-3-glycerol phosphate synthase TrpC [Virgibacillus sp.]
MTILDNILRQKEKEVELLRKQTFDKINFNKDIAKISETFARNLQMNIIAEIKRASPSKGAINSKVDPVIQARKYESSGAGAISILTDKTFFNGSMDDLRAVREAVSLPLLCKDFIIDKVQIEQAKAAGASIILLIVAALSESSLKSLYNYAAELDLEVLCEVHNEHEMERAIHLGAPIIGINNRDLKTFTVDLTVTKKLTSMVENPKTILISESGIATKEDVYEVAEHGANGILVGETLMRSENLSKTFSDLQIQVKEGNVNNAR